MTSSYSHFLLDARLCFLSCFKKLVPLGMEIPLLAIYSSQPREREGEREALFPRAVPIGFAYFALLCARTVLLPFIGCSFHWLCTLLSFFSIPYHTILYHTIPYHTTRGNLLRESIVGVVGEGIIFFRDSISPSLIFDDFKTDKTYGTQSAVTIKSATLNNSYARQSRIRDFFSRSITRGSKLTRAIRRQRENDGNKRHSRAYTLYPYHSTASGINGFKTRSNLVISVKVHTRGRTTIVPQITPRALSPTFAPRNRDTGGVSTRDALLARNSFSSKALGVCVVAHPLGAFVHFEENIGAPR